MEAAETSSLESWWRTARNSPGKPWEDVAPAEALYERYLDLAIDLRGLQRREADGDGLSEEEQKRRNRLESLFRDDETDDEDDQWLDEDDVVEVDLEDLKEFEPIDA
jgi:hypothetical protein